MMVTNSISDASVLQWATDARTYLANGHCSALKSINIVHSPVSDRCHRYSKQQTRWNCLEVSGTFMIFGGLQTVNRDVRSRYTRMTRRTARDISQKRRVAMRLTTRGLQSLQAGPLAPRTSYLCLDEYCALKRISRSKIEASSKCTIKLKYRPDKISLPCPSEGKWVALRQLSIGAFFIFCPQHSTCLRLWNTKEEALTSNRVCIYCQWELHCRQKLDLKCLMDLAA